MRKGVRPGRPGFTGHLSALCWWSCWYPSALNGGFSSLTGDPSLSQGCIAQQRVRPNVGSSSSAELGMPQAWPPLGTLPCLSLCSLRKRPEKYSPGERPRSSLILFPLLTMPFQADFSPLSARPLAPLSALGPWTHRAEQCSTRAPRVKYRGPRQGGALYRFGQWGGMGGTFSAER